MANEEKATPKYRIITRSQDGQRAEIVTQDSKGEPLTRHVHREDDANWHWRQEGPPKVHVIYAPSEEAQ